MEENKTAEELSPLPKPYKTRREAGIPIVKTLLHPALKQLVDVMNIYKGCYVGTHDNVCFLYINDKPAFKIDSQYLNDLKIILADDVREYSDITEYRLSPERYRQILIYYL